jgi:hypothetical protein
MNKPNTITAPANLGFLKGSRVKAVFVTMDCVETYDGLEDVVEERTVHGHIIEGPHGPGSSIITVDFGPQTKQPIKFQRFTYCEPNGEITRQWEAISKGPFDVAFLPDYH